MKSQFIKKTRYQRKVDSKFSQCLTCERKCKIALDKAGVCQTRLNKDGVIYSIIHGLIPAISFNLIEKKPLFHFYPGSLAITIGTYGCNFSCFWCQNHHISHPSKDILDLVKSIKEYFPPEKIIELGIAKNCQGTSVSFNEPTLLFEYSLELFELAKKAGMYNTYVTNGYMTEDVLKDLAKSGLDAMNIDIKGGEKVVKKYCNADIELVWKNVKLAKDLGIHIELTMLLIDGLNDDEKSIKAISKRIVNDLGKGTPFHLTRFFPHFKSHDYGLTKPTSIESLKLAYSVAKSSGLDFVYLGNLPHSNYENTYCPKCSDLVIERPIYGITKTNLDLSGNCHRCAFPIVKNA
jgi:pyruvate formate lyase activating enzyme